MNACWAVLAWRGRDALHPPRSQTEWQQGSKIKVCLRLLLHGTQAPGAPGWSPPSPQASPCPACAALAEVWRAHMDDRQFMEQLGQPPPLCDTCAQL